LRTFWTKQETDELLNEYRKRPGNETQRQFIRRWIQKHPGRTENSISGYISRNINGGIVEESPFEVFDNPLVMTGDALILNDLHCPYHHAEFINNCLSVAKSWGITQCIIGGDMADMKAISNWGDDFTDEETGEFSEAQSQKLHEFAMTLKGKAQENLMNILEQGGVYKKEHTSIDIEIEITGKVFKAIANQFERVHVCMGNHDNWLLRRLGQAIDAQTYQKILGVENEAWKFSSYYYTELQSGGQKWLIEHPNLAGKYSAWQLGANELCNIIMAHNHHVNWAFDRSGTYWAIESGCCADPARIEYNSKRHKGGHKPTMGAVIVKDGYPYMLNQKTNWDFVK
jgi:ribosomal protein S17E